MYIYNIFEYIYIVNFYIINIFGRRNGIVHLLAKVAVLRAKNDLFRNETRKTNETKKFK